MTIDNSLEVPNGIKPLPEAVLKLQKIINSQVSTTSNGVWDQAWLQKVTPWDHDSIQPALKELIEEKWIPSSSLESLVPFNSLKDGIALVAGCGRGYDATYFASKGFHSSWGVDISPTAVKIAEDFLKESFPNSNPPSNVEFKALDFFTFPPPSSPSISLAYDYTFLCASPIELRKPLGIRYSELIRPGGVLIALMYPLHGDRKGGPPYSLNPEIYQEIFGENFDRIYFEIPTGTDGSSRMSVWKRRDTISVNVGDGKL